MTNKRYQSRNGAVHGFIRTKTYCGMKKHVNEEGFSKEIEKLEISCLKCKRSMSKF